MVGPVAESLLRCEASQYIRLSHRPTCTFQPFLTVQTQRSRLCDTRKKGCSAANSSTMSTSEEKRSTSSLMQVSVLQQQFQATPEYLPLQQAALCCCQTSSVNCDMHI